MLPRTAALASLAIACASTTGLAQTNGLQNGGFETSCFFCGGPFPEGWHSPGGSLNAMRRFVGDGLLPAFSPVGTPPPALTPHTGNAVVQIKTDGNGGFFGVTTDTVNFCYCDQTCGTACTGPFPFFDPAFDYTQGDVVVGGWYMIPTDQAITGDAASIKIEIKFGNYDLATLENYASDGTGGSIIGTTNGEWRHFSVTFLKTNIVAQYECNVGIRPLCGCEGCEPAIPPNHCKITPSRFVGDNTPTTGTIYWDDITYLQLPASHCGSADFNCDGDVGTDSDIEAFFTCLAGTCPPAPCTSNADFNGDGDVGTDGDIEAFFRVLGGGTC
jgi:hypothetical protein